MTADPFIYLDMTIYFIFRAYFDVSLNLISVPLFEIYVLVVQFLYNRNRSKIHICFKPVY